MAFILLFAFWMVLNGKVTLEIVLVGLVLSFVLNLAISRLLTGLPKAGKAFVQRIPGILLYGCYLIGRIVISNLQVIRLILHPTKERPKLVWFQPKYHTGSAMLALANSITLTPGTVTVGMGDDTLCVYALRPEFGEGLAECGFATRLHRLEDGNHG